MDVRVVDVASNLSRILFGSQVPTAVHTIVSCNKVAVTWQPWKLLLLSQNQRSLLKDEIRSHALYYLSDCIVGVFHYVWGLRTTGSQSFGATSVELSCCPSLAFVIQWHKLFFTSGTSVQLLTMRANVSCWEDRQLRMLVTTETELKKKNKITSILAED